MTYSKKAIEYFKNPKFAGEMKDFDAVGEVGNVACGDIMRIYLKIKDDIVVDIRFLTYGCVGAISASEAMCILVKGKNLDEALKVTHKDIVEELEGLPQMKVHCSVLGREALHKAVENYRKNQ